MISTSGVSMRFGAKVLFDNVSIAFTDGKRYGLTGPNGSGKSTFMKLLSGELEPQKGSVVRPKKLGVLSQDQFAFDQYRVIDTVIMGNKALWAALAEREKLYEKTDLTDDDGMRLGDLEGIIGHEDGYTAESDAATLLDGLDIPQHLHERKMGELQGGQKVRVLLAQALFGHPQALLLDEPTNHLDLDSIHWLEEFLLRYDGSLIVISHDRHFLNRVCTHTADIDYETIIIYTGGYDDMVLAKTQSRAQIEAQNIQKEKKIAQLNEFIARFAAGTRSTQVTSRKKEVERLQTAELAKSNIQRPYIKFSMNRPSGRHALEFQHVSKSYGEHEVIRDFSANVQRGEKIAIIGRNGAGKTTLLNTLLANAPGNPYTGGRPAEAVMTALVPPPSAVTQANGNGAASTAKKKKAEVVEDSAPKKKKPSKELRAQQRAAALAEMRVASGDEQGSAANEAAPSADDRRQTTADSFVKWGHEVQVGLFEQDHKQSIEKGTTALEWLRQFDLGTGTERLNTEELRGLLGQMLFARDEGLKPTEALSGGEAARLIFCRIMLQKPNFLVLDEPTNHLDLESINALKIAIQRYEGTVLLVTHDEDLIDEVATRIWHLDHGKVEDFKGTYEEYLAAAPAATR